jgi:hypothetical protein
VQERRLADNTDNILREGDMMMLFQAFAQRCKCRARLAIRTAAVAAAVFTATGCAYNRLDRRVYVATTTDACAALGTANVAAGPAPVEVYRVSVLGRKHTIDNTQLAGGWMPAAADDQLLKPDRSDDAPPTVINPASEAAEPARPEPVLSLDSSGAVAHVGGGSRLVLLFGIDAQATLDEWMAAAANGRFVDSKVQAEAERTRLRADQCWLDAIRASLTGGSPTTATASSSEGTK